MARVNIHVPDELLAKYRALPGDDKPSISGLTQEALRRFISLDGQGPPTLTQRVDNLEHEIETLVTMLRAAGVNI